MGLKNSINWDKFGMQVVADAADGKTAYELYEKLKPDLIVTDLNMPIMSGMDLISRIRERDKTIKIIILTCLEEFELARKAVSLGVTDYIVKHMMTESTIEEILAGIQRELSAGRAYKSAYEINGVNAGIIQEKRIKDLILYDRRTEDAIATVSEKLHTANDTEIMLFIMQISHYDRIKSPIVRDSILNMLNDVFSYCRNGGFAFEDDGKFVAVFGAAQNAGARAAQNDALLMLNEIDSSLKGLFNTTASFGLSLPECDFGSLHGMYLHAARALEDRFFGGAGVYGYSAPFDRGVAIREKTEEMLKSCGNPANHLVGLYAEYFARIRSIAACFGKSAQEYREAFCGLIQWVTSTARIPGDGNERITVSAVSAIESVRQSETLDEILRSMYVFFTQFSTVIRKKQITSKEVKQAVDVIESGYGSDLSLQQVADSVGLSPNYLSGLFKKEVNANFTEYLTEVRIERAKELLLDTYLKTYEIAESVGYRENAYFCKTFKKVTGKTPGDFRRQWLKRWSEEPDDETIRT